MKRPFLFDGVSNGNWVVVVSCARGVKLFHKSNSYMDCYCSAFTSRTATWIAIVVHSQVGQLHGMLL